MAREISVCRDLGSYQNIAESPNEIEVYNNLLRKSLVRALGSERTATRDGFGYWGEAMNIRAAQFVNNLRGAISPSEKSVAFVMAIHADFKNAVAYMSMTTLAAESSLKNRETASRIVARLVLYGIIRVVGTKSKGRGTTKYQFTFKTNRDSGVTVKNNPTVTGESQSIGKPTVTPGEPNRDSGGENTCSTVTQNASTVTGESQEGFKVLQFKEEKKAESTPKPSPPPFSKSGTGEPSRPRIDLSAAEGLTDGIIAHAKGINKRASFSGQSKRNLKEAVCKIITADGYARVEDLTRDLYEITQEKVHACDVFDLRNVGSSLAAELIPSVAEKQRYRLRQEQAKAESESAREEFESNRRYEEAQKELEKQWFIDFELVRNGSTEELTAWANSYSDRYLPEFGEAAELFKKVYDERAAEELATTTGKEATA